METNEVRLHPMCENCSLQLDEDERSSHAMSESSAVELP